MKDRYPLLPDDMHQQEKVIPVYFDLCDKLVNTPGKTWVFYSEVYEVVSGRLAWPTVKALLKRMDDAGIIRRSKNGANKFSAYDKLYLTPAGRHWLTCVS